MLDREQPCYYVSCVNDVNQLALLLGSYETHQEALDNVRRATDMAYKVDPRAPWYAYGTVKMANGHREGKLNKLCEEAHC